MRIEHIGDATLYLGDCLDGMREMPDLAFDLAIVDPPYGSGGGDWESKPRSRFGGIFDKYDLPPPIRQSNMPSAADSPATISRRGGGGDPNGRNVEQEISGDTGRPP